MKRPLDKKALLSGLLIVLAAPMTVAAVTSWLSQTYSTTDLNTGAKPVTMATDNGDGTWSPVGAANPVPTTSSDGPVAGCANYRGTTATVAANSSGTTVDAGATGTVNWLAVMNTSRTYDIEIDVDTGSTRVPPLTSLTLSKYQAETADSVVVSTDCAECATGATTKVSLLACDDD